MKLISFFQSRAMSLGYDVNGNEYTYFPQFCGDDVRIYRHRQYADLQELEPPDPLLVLKPQKDKILLPLHQSNANPEAAEESVSEQLPSLNNGVDNENEDVSVSISNDVNSESSEIKDGLEKINKNVEVPEEPISSQPAALTSDTKLNCEDQTVEVNGITHGQIENKSDDTDSKIVNKTVDTAASESILDDSVDTDALTPDDDDNLETAAVTDNQKLAANTSSNFLHLKHRKRTSNFSTHSEIILPPPPKTDDSENCYDSSDAQWTPKKKKKKKL